MIGIAVSVGSLSIAIEITEVGELIPNCALAGTAGSLLGECGVFNLRGQLVRVLDLGVCLGVPSAARLTEKRLVVLTGRWSGWALRVDSVDNTLQIAVDAFAEESPTPGAIGVGDCLGRPCIDSEHRTVLTLRLDRLFAATQRALSGSAALPEAATPLTLDESRVLEERRRALLPRRREDPEVVEDGWLAAVTIDGECYGLLVQFVREFVRVPKTVRLPGAPPRVAGLLSLRGEILCALHPVLDGKTGRRNRPFAVVLESGGARAALLVDSVLEVISYGSTVLQAAPLDSRMPITGVLRWSERFITVLDVSQLFREAGAGPQLESAAAEE